MARVLIYFPTKQNSINYEGVRFRKTLKGACELLGITYTDKPNRRFEICNILAARPKELAVWHRAKRAKRPVVVWALRCENDPEARMLFNDGGTFKLLPDAFKILNEADLVLAPSIFAREFLREQGIERPMLVLADGINLARFNKDNVAEKALFNRYFKTKPTDNVVISTGGIDDDSGIEDVILIARLVPNAQFYYFAVNDIKLLGSKRLSDLQKLAPVNLTISNLVPDDVYRSALMNASIFLEPAKKYASTISIMEAMASETQVIIRNKAFYKDGLINYDTCFVGADASSLAELIARYLKHEFPSKTAIAKQLVMQNDLPIFAQSVKEIFEKL